jgi:hypothetical protein
MYANVKSRFSMQNKRNLTNSELLSKEFLTRFFLDEKFNQIKNYRRMGIQNQTIETQKP